MDSQGALALIICITVICAALGCLLGFAIGKCCCGSCCCGACELIFAIFGLVVGGLLGFLLIASLIPYHGSVIIKW